MAAEALHRLSTNPIARLPSAEQTVLLFRVALALGSDGEKPAMLNDGSSGELWSLQGPIHVCMRSETGLSPFWRYAQVQAPALHIVVFNPSLDTSF